MSRLNRVSNFDLPRYFHKTEFENTCFDIHRPILESASLKFTFTYVLNRDTLGLGKCRGVDLLLQNEFKDFWVSLLSTSAMMADGFGYEDHRDVHIVDKVVISHLISSIFLIMMAIIIMNLMVGVAVSDVEEVYMHAIESHSTLQIEHILELERICQAILNILVRFRCTKKFGARLKVRFIQQPNREVLAGRLKSEEVPKHIRDKDQSENLGQKLDELISLKEDMCNLMRLMKEEHERLREIAVR